MGKAVGGDWFPRLWQGHRNKRTFLAQHVKGLSMGQSCDFALRPVPVVTNVGHLCAKGRNLDQCRIARKRQDIDEIHPVTVRGRKTHHRDVVGIKGIKPDRDFLTR